MAFELLRILLMIIDTMMLWEFMACDIYMIITGDMESDDVTSIHQVPGDRRPKLRAIVYRIAKA